MRIVLFNVQSNYRFLLALQSSYKMFGASTPDNSGSSLLGTTPINAPTVFLHDNKRKQRRIRTTFTSLQLRELEKCFQQVRNDERTIFNQLTRLY